VENASSEWIAFTDAGIRLQKDWLQNMVLKAGENGGADIVYGDYSPQLNSFFDKCASITYVAPLQKNKIRSTFIASSLLKKKVWETVGGFPDWRATEDIVFMENAAKAGFRIAEAPAAMVYWQLRPGLSSTFKRFDLYSKYNVWAGRQAYWHYGVARQYAIMLIPVLLGIFHSWYWFLILPLWMMARTAKRIVLHRHEFGWKTLFNPAVFFMVMLISLVIDAATFTGWIKAVMNKNGLKTTVSNA
jgi:GT2 family glycosyltransferase